MNPEGSVPAEIDQDTLRPLEAMLGATAAINMIGSIFLKGRAGKRAFLVGAAALIPFVYRLHKHEEAWHEQHPWVRQGGSEE